MQFTPAPGSDPLPEAPAPAQEGARAPTQQDLEFTPAPGSLSTNPQARYIAPPRPPQTQFSTSEVAGDLARSLGSGLVRSVAAIPGIPGSLREAYESVSPGVGRFFNVQTNMPQAEADRIYNERQQELARTRETRAREGTSLPTIEDIYNRVSQHVPLVNYEPRTMAGRITQTGAEFLNPLGDITLPFRAAAAIPRGVNLIREGSNVVSGLGRGTTDLMRPAVSAGNIGAATGSVGAGELTHGTEAEPWARLGGGLSGAVAGPGVRNIAQSLNPERVIANAMRVSSPMDKGLTVEQARAALTAGQAPSIVELQGARKPIAGAMARHPETPEGNAIQQQLLDNQANANRNFRIAMDDITGGENNVFQARKEARDAAGLSNEYNALYRNPAGNFIWDNELENLFHDDAALAAMRRASVAVSRENNVPHEFPFTQGQNGTWHISPIGSHDPNIQFWDYTLRELRNAADKPENLGHTANSLNQLVERLRGKLGSTQNGGLDEFGELLARGSNYFRGNDAFDDGLGFFNLANTGRKQADVEAFNRQMDIFNNKYSNVEKNNFRTALANHMIENVDSASSVFARNDNVFFDRMRQVFGEDQFNRIRNSMNSYNTVKNVQRINAGDLSGRGSSSIFNAILSGVATGAGPYLIGAVSPVAGTAIAAGTAAAVNHLSNMAKNVAANRLLRMAASNDPNSVRRIIELANERPEYARALQQMTPYLQTITRAATPQENEFVSRSDGSLPATPEPVVAGPRATRASGGRISSNHRAKAQALINAAERAKKAHNGNTKPILDMPDETVAKALSLADQAI